VTCSHTEKEEVKMVHDMLPDRASRMKLLCAACPPPRLHTPSSRQAGAAH
jgi:hypothetical protein